MNSEHIQDFLTRLAESDQAIVKEGRDEFDVSRKFFADSSSSTHLCMNYLCVNYTDIDVVQPITGQLLALYYRKGVLRLYVLQYIPVLIGCYLLAVSKKQQKSIAMLETFFLAIYNEEIMKGEPGTSLTKKVEEIRIPSMSHPSIYHDPVKMHAVTDIPALKQGSTPPVVCTVKIGPYPTIDTFTVESKFLVLTRLLKSVNSYICYISSDVLSRYICLTTLAAATSGFSFPETSFRSKVLQSEHSNEVLEDYSKKSRQHVSSALLLEMIYGVYLALFNGAPDLALRAIDGVHQRAQYEMLPDVLLVTNAIRNSLLENPLSKEKRDEMLRSRSDTAKSRKDLVTSASLRIKRMPEDIPVQEAKEKEQSKLEELVEEGIDHLHDLKKKMTSITLHSKAGRRRKSVEHHEAIELQSISEERSVTELSYPSPVLQHEQPSNSEPQEGGANNVMKTNGHPHSNEISHNGGSPETTKNSSENERERGVFSVGGLRHMDSGSSTQRSIDLP